MAAYEISNRALSEDDPELQTALRAAHASGVRPLCLCRPLSAKPPMVIERRTAGGPAANGQDAQANDLYILRRMPERGDEHAPTCKHYEAPEGLSGRTGHLDGAIRSDDDGLHHRLRLAFPLSHKEKGPRRTRTRRPAIRRGRANAMRGFRSRASCITCWKRPISTGCTRACMASAAGT